MASFLGVFLPIKRYLLVSDKLSYTDVYLLHVLAMHVSQQCPIMARHPEHVAVSNRNQTYNINIIVLSGSRKYHLKHISHSKCTETRTSFDTTVFKLRYNIC